MTGNRISTLLGGAKNGKRKKISLPLIGWKKKKNEERKEMSQKHEIQNEMFA